MTISPEKLKVQAHGRLWRLIQKRGVDECWPWLGPKTKGGYGLFGISGRYSTAHRAVYQEFYGKLRKHFYALHSCDNPGCCNPAHLWAGTQKQNIQDMIAKGRLKRHGQPGESHWKAKLTDKQV
jgi:hypothetical protein